MIESEEYIVADITRVIEGNLIVTRLARHMYRIFCLNLDMVGTHPRLDPRNVTHLDKFSPKPAILLSGVEISPHLIPPAGMGSSNW